MERLAEAGGERDLAGRHLLAERGQVGVLRAADRLVHDTVDQVAVARRSLVTSAGRVWWIVRPLAWRIDSLAATDSILTRHSVV